MIASRVFVDLQDKVIPVASKFRWIFTVTPATLPVSDPEGPWGSTSCPTCEGICKGHGYTTQRRGYKPHACNCATCVGIVQDDRECSDDVTDNSATKNSSSSKEHMTIYILSVPRPEILYYTNKLSHYYLWCVLDLVHRLISSGRLLVWDATCVFAPSTASEVCAAAKQVEQTKIKKYSYIISHVYHSFTPVVFETIGASSPRSILGTLIKNLKMNKTRIFMHSLKEQIECIKNMLLSRITSSCHA